MAANPTRRRAGIDAFLTKPVKHSDFLDALATLFRVSARRPRPERAVQPSARPEQRLRVLLAEDNAVNRKLVTKVLQKRGHHVQAVDNGRAAADTIALTTPAFDVVLMDLQMPEMSGFEATHAIRERERSTSRACSDRGAHRSCDGGRSRALPGGRDGWLPVETD